MGHGLESHGKNDVEAFTLPQGDKTSFITVILLCNWRKRVVGLFSDWKKVEVRFEAVLSPSST